VLLSFFGLTNIKIPLKLPMDGNMLVRFMQIHSFIRYLVFMTSFLIITISLILSSVSIQEHKEKKTFSLLSLFIFLISLTSLIFLFYCVFFVALKIEPAARINSPVIASHAVIFLLVSCLICFLWIIKFYIKAVNQDYLIKP
jgi:hypothetical protein